MPITEVVTPFGRVYLGTSINTLTRFTTDPEVYEPLNWQKRYSVHQTLQGGVTIQDFGIFGKDNIVRLGSGNGALLDTFVVDDFHTKYRVRGAVYVLKDWMSNCFNVFMSDFKAVPNIVGPLWRYEMLLQVTAINTLFGQAYTGN